MTVIRTATDGLRHHPAAQAPVAAQLRGYWQGLRTGSALPRRDQFEPRMLAPLLRSVFLIDWTAQGAARFRIAGQIFTALYGMELHGAPLALLFEPSERVGIGAMVRRVCDGPATVDMVLRSEGGAGRPALTGRMMILPVVDRCGTGKLAIGSLEVTGMVGQAPRRFRVERCLRAPLG